MLLSKHKNAGLLRTDPATINNVIELYTIEKKSVVQIAKILSCHHSTVSRTLKRQNVKVTYNNKASGEKNWNWKGGVTKNQIRFTPEYKAWRRQVFKRDDYTCQQCFQKGGRLEADHIKPQSLFKELILEVSNGRTLCKDCHKKTDTYLQKAKNFTRADFE